MATITINGNTLDPQAPGISTLGLESEDASESNYILIQSTGSPFNKAQKNELKELGVEIQEYVSENTYLCGYKPKNLKVLRDLLYVGYANVYQQAFVLQPSLKPSPESSAIPSLCAPLSRIPRTVDILVHDNVDINAIKDHLAEAAHIDLDDLATDDTKKVRLIVQEQFLDDVAKIDGVKFVKEAHPIKLLNNIARCILHADVIINDTEYEGDGQIVAIGDTGFDTGELENPHPAFTGRVKRLYGLGRTSRYDDPDGHGTHVAGSVLGSGFSESMGGDIKGAAPKAQLVLQSLLDSRGGLGGIPPNLGDLFLPPYRDDGARIHTNSWGSVSSRQLPYDGSAADIDEFVCNHPDMVILFAAGNDGKDGDKNGVIDPAQIGSQAAAKNCITVGATENLRPDIKISYGSNWPSSYPTAPIFNDYVASSAEGMAAFSSRGPTKEKRIKPDVVAPGTSILSTRSRKITRAPRGFGDSNDANWMFLGGTSMATPLVAGCVAVLRETLVKNGVETPSAALIKALLINGADHVQGQYTPSETGPCPNGNAGWGRVDVAGSVIISGKTPNAGFGESDPGNPLDQDEEVTVGEIVIPTAESDGSPPSHTFKITLVWSDPSGAMLQNDLDLIVVDSSGSERHGNIPAPIGRQTTPAVGFDRINNVEQLLWEGLKCGEKLTVKVRAYRITKVAPAFAWAWRID
jgi:subtilisin family serine protease